MDANKELLYAYMAGFVDADGYISIISTAKQKQYTAKIAVTNTNYEIIKLFSDTFGGKIRQRKHENKNWKISYEWSRTSNKGLEVITKLRPYLFLKNKQADLTVKLQDLRKELIKKDGKLVKVHIRWHPELWLNRVSQMNELKNQCLILNKRGL